MKDKIETSAQVVLNNLAAEILVREEELAQSKSFKELNKLKAAQATLGELYGIEAEAGAAGEPARAKVPKVAKAATAEPKKRGSYKKSPPTVAAPPAAVAPAGPGRPVVTWPANATEEKPTTMGAAMKWIGKQLAPMFTRAEMKAAIEADKDWSKLHGQSPTAFSGNLIYWSNTSKLKRTGEKETEQFHVINLDF